MTSMNQALHNFQLQDIVNQICPICKKQVQLDNTALSTFDSNCKETMFLSNDSSDLDIEISSGQIIQQRFKTHYNSFYDPYGGSNTFSFFNASPFAMIRVFCRGLFFDDIHYRRNYEINTNLKMVNNKYYLEDISLYSEVFYVDKMQITNWTFKETQVSFSDTSFKSINLPYISPNYEDFNQTINRIKTLINFS